MIIVCLIRVLPFILFFRFGRFHFQISNVSLSLSFALHEVFNYQGWNTNRPTPSPPARYISEAAASLRDLSFILLCIPSPYLHWKPLLLLHFLQHVLFTRTKSALPSQRQLPRGEGCWGLSEHHDHPSLLWEADLILGGKKIKDADFTASRSHSLKLTHAI